MKWLIYALGGVIGGILGGMGMGGGTLLIPLLTIFCNVGQHAAQAVNLVSFIPMAIIALIIHLKNKLVEAKNVLWIIIPGVLSCVGGCFVSKAISGDLLTKLFGGFLIILSIFQVVIEAKNR